MALLTPLVQSNNRLYKTYASRLAKLRILTIEDFLYHLPSRYEDYSVISKINQIQPGETVTVQGQVLDIKNQYLRNARIKTIQKASLSDDTGTMELVWFNQPFLTKTINKNTMLSVSGSVNGLANKLSMQSPEYEILTSDNPIHTGRLIPIYPETKGISSKWLRRQIHTILQEYKSSLIEYLPKNILERFHFPPLEEAIQEIHFPRNHEQASIARKRLGFDELFLLQLASIERRKEWQRNNTGQPLIIQKYQKELTKFIDSLPFKLTTAQEKAIKEILHDLEQTKQMNRLLQGDVGSGKTVVAAMAMYLAYLNNCQSVFLAPTEILAEQHFTNISKLLSPFGIKVGIVTGSKKLKSEAQNPKIPSNPFTKGGTEGGGFISAGAGFQPAPKRSEPSYKLAPAQIKEKNLNSKHDFDILVGTHALLSKKIKSDRLALVIIDEQQRFGVEQRSLIRKKGDNPHLLTMTATPIPRTVALTMYGDLDLSYLNEMPQGRKKIKTWLVPPEKREGAYNWIRKQINETDSQAFIICPFIKESESMQTVKAAAKEYEHLKKEVFPDLTLALLHGKLKSKEKERVMSDFQNKKSDILVATPVVEVGIDIPNATIIMIEASERFGLAQLHQLRGRVGRRDQQSYCLLFSENQNESITKRLKSLETIDRGVELAQLDLRIRGQGDIYGTSQHGVPKLKVASFSDTALIQKAKHVADEIFPHLSNYVLLKQKVTNLTLKKVAPD